MATNRAALWKSRLARFNFGASASVVGALLGVVRNKWLALHLDASGLGVLAQVSSAQIWLGTATGLGLNVPVTRAVGAATAADDVAAIRRTTATAFTMVAVAAGVIALLGLLCASALSQLVLGTPAHAGLVRVSMIGVAGLALQLTLLGVFAGRSDVRAPLTLVASGAMVATALVFVLVPRFGLMGGALSTAILFPTGVAVALWIHRRDYWNLLGPLGRGFDPALGRALLAVGAVMLALALVDLGTMLAVRAHYVRMNGNAANGLFQAALALAQQVGGTFYTYLSSYAFGRISGANGAAGIRDYTRRHWIPLIALAALVMAVVMVAAGPLLHLLYSHRFDPARPMLAWTLVGEFSKVGMQVWALGALPLAGTGLVFATGVSYSLALAVSYRLLTLAGAGAMSLPYAYACAGLVGLIVAGTLMSRRGVTIGWRDAGVLAAGLVGLALLARVVAG